MIKFKNFSKKRNLNFLYPQIYFLSSNRIQFIEKMAEFYFKTNQQRKRTKINLKVFKFDKNQDPLNLPTFDLMMSSEKVLVIQVHV